MAPSENVVSSDMAHSEEEAVLTAPQKLSDEEVLRITPNLVRGLAELGFDEYKIYKFGSKNILIGGATKDRGEAVS